MATTKTELYNNGTLVATKTAAPFNTFDWTPASGEVGSASLTVKRYEDGVLAATSAAVGGTVDAAASTYETETTNFFTATSTPNDANPSIYTGLTNADCWDLMDSVIKYYKTNGVWADIYHWHPIFGDTAEKAKYNVKDTTAHQMTWKGQWVFSAAGAQGQNDGTFNPTVNTYGILNFNQNTLMSRDNFGISLVTLSTAADAYFCAGNQTNGRGDGGIAGSNNRYNYGVGGTGGAVTSAGELRGIWATTNDGVNVKAWRNGAERKTTAFGGTGALANESAVYGTTHNAESSLNTNILSGDVMHHKATNIDIIHEGLRMWNEGLGRKTWA
jgi:hypothetical protein